MNLAYPPDVPRDIIERITSAADKLYDENDRESFPTVDAVRRMARADMNVTSNVMRIWRAAQTAAQTPSPAPMPEAVQNAGRTLLNTLWAAANASASAGLQSAQVGWEMERADAEACRHQLATAFDSQTEELDKAMLALAGKDEALHSQADALKAAAARLEKQEHEAREANARAEKAEALVAEIAKRAVDLKAELSRAHAVADQDSAEAASELRTSQILITQLREELGRKLTRESDFGQELRRLRVQIEAMEAKREELQAALKPNGNDASQLGPT